MAEENQMAEGAAVPPEADDKMHSSAAHARKAAEDLRSAAHALGRLLGQVGVEDILDVIFHEFCIGK